MKIPRISNREAPAALERVMATNANRFGIAIVAVGITSAVAFLLRGQVFAVELSLLILYGAILLSSVLGGFGPGLLATFLSAISAHYVVMPSAAFLEIIRLAAEGGMLSIVGGTLRVARYKAKQRLQDNLDLEQRILEISDEERRRIGHDLHDGLGQHLTGISLLSESITQQLEAGKAPSPATSETITRLVSQSVQITRDLAKSLSPVTLERDGLVAAVEELAAASSSLFGINCRSELDDDQLVLDRPRSLHLYRIIQEAVNNSVRHGKAKNVQILMNRDSSELRIQVVDDGCGLSEKTMNNPGIGLRIMQYRARMLGATIMVERAQTKSGTIVICKCPFDSGGVEIEKSFKAGKHDPNNNGPVARVSR